MEQIAIQEHNQFDALLSDEVVMQWLMDLETECQEPETQVASNSAAH